MSSTGSGISILGAADTSCSIKAAGKIAARSCGPAGLPVPGCKGGGKGAGRSGITLYQNFGISRSERVYLIWFIVGSTMPECAQQVVQDTTKHQTRVDTGPHLIGPRRCR